MHDEPCPAFEAGFLSVFAEPHADAPFRDGAEFGLWLIGHLGFEEASRRFGPKGDRALVAFKCGDPVAAALFNGECGHLVSPSRRGGGASA